MSISQASDKRTRSTGKADNHHGGRAEVPASRRSTRNANSRSDRAQILEAAMSSDLWAVNGEAGFSVGVRTPGRTQILKKDCSEEIVLEFNPYGALVGGSLYKREHRGNLGTAGYLLKDITSKDKAGVLAHIAAQ